VSASGSLIPYINVKLALLGMSPVETADGAKFNEIVSTLIAQVPGKGTAAREPPLSGGPPDPDLHYDYLQDVPVVKLPQRTFVLDRPGMARELSLPVDRDEFVSDIVSSYRAKQGVLHNPRSDRRTTQGIFHVAEGGLPVPGDKQAVPKEVFGKLLALALNPPNSLLRLPFTATQPQPAECFASLLIRPVVCPEVAGFTAEKTMENPVFCARQSRQQSRFCREYFRQWRRSEPAGERRGAGCRTLDGPHRLCDPGAASDQDHQKGGGTAAMGHGNGTPAP